VAHPLCKITRSISVAEKPVFIEEDWRFHNLRGTEEEALERSHWLQAESECESTDRSALLARLAAELNVILSGRVPPNTEFVILRIARPPWPVC